MDRPPGKALDDDPRPESDPRDRDRIDPSKPRQLLVEGPDELGLLRVLLTSLDISDVQVHDVGGKDNFAIRLRQLVNAPGFESVIAIGIIRDADESAASARQSIEGSLKKFGLPMPDKADANVGSPALRTGLLILPDGQSDGSLETLLLQAVANDPAMPCVEEYIACLTRGGRAPGFAPDKARLLAFLASRDRHAAQIGVAARQNVFDWAKPAFDQLKEFLRTF